MDIFISWSGQRSERVALALHEWLPAVVQAAKPWLSREIEKGSRWDDAISDSLERCSFGIICLTPENLNSDWLLFEAGALSKKVRDARVCTYLFDLRESDVVGPLAKFQHTRAEREDTGRLLSSLNRYLQEPIESPRLRHIFDTWWPQLDQALKDIPTSPTGKSTRRSAEDMLSEILLEVRQLRRHQTEIRQQHQPSPSSASARSTVQFGQAVDKLVARNREDPERPVIVTLPDVVALVDVRDTRCKTHGVPPLISGLGGSAYELATCCARFMTEVSAMLCSQEPSTDTSVVSPIAQV